MADADGEGESELDAGLAVLDVGGDVVDFGRVLGDGGLDGLKATVEGFGGVEAGGKGVGGGPFGAGGVEGEFERLGDGEAIEPEITLSEDLEATGVRGTEGEVD